MSMLPQNGFCRQRGVSMVEEDLQALSRTWQLSRSLTCEPSSPTSSHITKGFRSLARRSMRLQDAPHCAPNLPCSQIPCRLVQLGVKHVSPQ